jgi:hypothetical protein
MPNHCRLVTLYTNAVALTKGTGFRLYSRKEDGLSSPPLPTLLTSFIVDSVLGGIGNCLKPRKM